jgi:hypothetical protein
MTKTFAEVVNTVPNLQELPLADGVDACKPFHSIAYYGYEPMLAWAGLGGWRDSNHEFAFRGPDRDLQ